jgi:RNA recognition motif-containing protein
MIAPDECRVFASNWSYAADEETIREVAEGYGEVVDVFLMRDFGTNQSRGMAIIGCASAEDARKIIAGLAGFNHLGRTLRAELARPRGT